MTDKTGETVMNGERTVTAGKTVESRSTGSSVHTTGRGTDVDNGNSHALLIVRYGLLIAGMERGFYLIYRCLDLEILRLSSGHVGSVVLLEFCISQFHGAFEILVLDASCYRLSLWYLISYLNSFLLIPERVNLPT